MSNKQDLNQSSETIDSEEKTDNGLLANTEPVNKSKKGSSPSTHQQVLNSLRRQSQNPND